MRSLEEFHEQTDALTALMRVKLGVRGSSFAAVLARAGRHLPRHIRADGQMLSQALSRADHPRLALTLDLPSLQRAAQSMRTHLDGIDVADRRWGFFLGLLGGMAFNLLAFAALLILFLVWRGLV